MAVNRNPEHPWAYMDNIELLKSAGLYGKNLTTGEEGFNLAAMTIEKIYEQTL